jgi:Family of unknown function (DUF5954)/Putative exonuclease SbcCD, C subunit
VGGVLGRSGATRSPRTLSGGETFLASLALALALVELHSRTGARLGALFLDEGFGLLDVDTLATALTVPPAETGEGKLVAVISHLYVVAEAVEDVIWVERHPEGSVANWLSEDACDAPGEPRSCPMAAGASDSVWGRLGAALEVAGPASAAAGGYPRLVGAHPVFQAVEQVGDRWLFLGLEASITSQDARDDLAHQFLVRAAGADEGGQEQEGYRAAAGVLDRERHDEMTAAGRRFRIARAEQVLRTGPDGPEPPRPEESRRPGRDPAWPRPGLAATRPGRDPCTGSSGTPTPTPGRHRRCSEPGCRTR